MTSRFRSNWTKERVNSSLPTFDSATCHNSHCPIDDDVRIQCYKDVRADDDIANSENHEKAIFRNRYGDDGIEKLCDKDVPGASHCGDDYELDEDRNSPARNYHRGSFRENFRYRGDIEVEHCRQRERRAPIEKKDTGSSSAIGSSTARYDLAESGSDDTIHERRFASSSLMTTTTNGNSPISAQGSNGSAKQVKRIDPRRDHHKTIGSLTRGERPVMEDSSIASADFRADDVTNQTQMRAKDSSKENKRDRSVKRSMRDERNEEFNLTTEAVGRSSEIDDYGTMDRSSGMKGPRDRSYSPVRRFVNVSNGVSSERRFQRRTKDRNDYGSYSPDRKSEEENDFRCIDRRSRRHADGRSYSPIDGNDVRMLNGNCDISTTRSERLSKRDKGEELDSKSKRLGKGRLEERGFVHGYDDDVDVSRRENGSCKKHSNINEDSCQPGRGVPSGVKNHTRHKATPEEFDVQIHRYERALRVSRKDSDLSRKTSFKDHDGDLSRKSSFKDHHRSKDYNVSKNNNDRQRNLEAARRGSSEDRDNDRGSRKNSFKNRYTESTKKNAKTARNLSDIGIAVDGMDTRNNNNRNNINNIHSRKNGSYHRDRPETVRRDYDLSATTRKSSRCNEDEDEDDEDHDRSPWKNDRHSRPLTPPKLVGLEDRDCSKDQSSRISSSSSKERVSQNEDDLAHNHAQNRDECRGKTRDPTGLLSVSRGRDRYPSSVKKVVSTRSFSESCHDNFNARRAARLDAVSNNLASRDLVVDDEDQCDDREHLSFSTIEKNGTTVIRIRTDSQSPVGQGDARSRRRASHREVASAARYQKYEDEAEDEDEDDEVFERGNQRRDYRVGPRRFWSNQGGGVQITDLDEGQPCLHCGETCPGFSPHSWRKNCTSCKCPREAHDVCHEEWVSVRARLGLKGEGPNSSVGFDPRDRGLTWAPPGLSPSKVEEYFSMLPEISVPRIGTPGERHRDRQLATQLPKQDLARAYCRHLDSQHSASADDFMAARNEIALDIGSVKEILERGHKCGVCQEPLKYGSLVISASKLGLSYHPSCFQCTQCQELLVDLAYCVHDDALYCERHYAEQLKPRCAACDELIFSGEYTKAMNKDWHSGHFCCWQCDESLTGQRYVLRDEHPYCIKCYESVFANGCEECNKIIGIDSKDLSYKDKHWHEACFLCNKCRVSLVDKQFGSKVDKIYCGNCYDAQFASRCDGCGEIFRAGTKKMEYKTRQWHEKCFCCVVCKNPIGTKSFIPREQEIYCAGCYEDKFATRCVKCNKIITSGGVTYKNEPWHRDCFTCSNCNNSLAGQRFTSRDDKPYCAECFGELFAKRCTACTKPITGIGGTRFISFEDRHWHNNCFICAGCNTSLVGRGFITDGDDIICPECAKQKLSE